jgi:hypothetical protein
MEVLENQAEIKKDFTATSGAFCPFTKPAGYSRVSIARSVPHSFTRSEAAIQFALLAFSGRPAPFIARPVGH